MKFIKNKNYICYSKQTKKRFQVLEINKDVVHLRTPITNRIIILIRNTTFVNDYWIPKDSKLII